MIDFMGELRELIEECNRIRHPFQNIYPMWKGRPLSDFLIKVEARIKELEAELAWERSYRELAEENYEELEAEIKELEAILETGKSIGFCPECGWKPTGSWVVYDVRLSRLIAREKDLEDLKASYYTSRLRECKLEAQIKELEKQLNFELYSQSKKFWREQAIEKEKRLKELRQAAIYHKEERKRLRERIKELEVENERLKRVKHTDKGILFPASMSNEEFVTAITHIADLENEVEDLKERIKELEDRFPCPDCG